MKQEIDTLLNLAYIYMNYGKARRAVDYLLIANRLDPDNIQIQKMKVAAFRDLGAFPQALEVIAQLEVHNNLSKNDLLTLQLMKSFCLKGQGNLEEAQKVFNGYVKARKEVASKDFMKKYRKQLLRISQEQERERQRRIQKAAEEAES